MTPELDAAWAVECKKRADHIDAPLWSVIAALRADLAMADKRYAELVRRLP